MSESPEIVVTSLSESTKSRIIDTSLSDNLNEKAADAPDTRDASTSQNVGGRHTMASSEKEVNPLDKSSSTSKQNADASAEKEVYNFDEIRPLSNTRDGTLSSVSGFPNLYNGADAPEVVVNVPNSSSENPQSMEHSTEKEAASDHAGSPLNKPNRLQASPGDNDRPPQYSSNAPDQDSTFAGCRSIQPDNEEDINRANKRLAEAQRVMPRVNTEWNSSFWACCSPCGLGKLSIISLTGRQSEASSRFTASLCLLYTLLVGVDANPLVSQVAKAYHAHASSLAAPMADCKTLTQPLKPVQMPM